MVGDFLICKLWLYKKQQALWMPLLQRLPKKGNTSRTGRKRLWLYKNIIKSSKRPLHFRKAKTRTGAQVVEKPKPQPAEQQEAVVTKPVQEVQPVKNETATAVATSGRIVQTTAEGTEMIYTDKDENAVPKK